MELVAVSHTWFWSPDTCRAMLGPHTDKICREILPMVMSGFVNKPLWWKCIQAKALKWKCHHFDEILIIGCTGSCHFDNFQCSQWWKFHQNNNISLSVRDGLTKAPKIQTGSIKSYGTIHFLKQEHHVEWFIVAVGIGKNSRVASLSVACNIIGKVFVCDEGTEKVQKYIYGISLGIGKDTDNEGMEEIVLLASMNPLFIHRYRNYQDQRKLVHSANGSLAL